jgi:hypothetical protein
MTLSVGWQVRGWEKAGTEKKRQIEDKRTEKRRNLVLATGGVGSRNGHGEQ